MLLFLSPPQQSLYVGLDDDDNGAGLLGNQDLSVHLIVDGLVVGTTGDGGGNQVLRGL